MVKGDPTGTLDKTKQFVAGRPDETSNWVGGKIIDDKGKPFAVKGKLGEEIVSDKFTYGKTSSDKIVFDWIAKNGKNDEKSNVPFKTNTGDLFGGSGTGLDVFVKDQKTVIPQILGKNIDPLSIFSKLFSARDQPE